MQAHCHALRRPALRLAAALLALVATTACSPALDWREVRPEGAHLQLMFPCKPASEARRIEVQGRSLEMRLSACKTGASSFALSFVDVGDPAMVGPALRLMRESLAAKVAAQGASPVPFAVPGMTPQPEAQRQALAGRLPDGAALGGVVAVFARGTVVYQAVVLGDRVDAAAIDGFLDGIKFPS